MTDTCEATTRDGSPCNNKATDGDYCHIPSHTSEAADGHAPVNPQRKVDPSQFAEALRAKDGVVRKAAEAVELSKSAAYEYIDEFDECARAKEKGNEALVDLSKSVLRQKMKDEGNLEAAKHVSRHYDRDAKTQQDVTSNDQTVGQGPDWSELTTEELREFVNDDEDSS